MTTPTLNYREIEVSLAGHELQTLKALIRDACETGRIRICATPGTYHGAVEKLYAKLNQDSWEELEIAPFPTEPTQ